jgi:hypothetical protein
MRKENPVAYLHTMWQEFGQKQTRVTESSTNPWGVPGKDYRECYPVTSEPLVRRDKKVIPPFVRV